MPDSQHVYTPSELNLAARRHIEAGFPRVWVEGEISNLSRPASGHLYFSLKDERAQLDCALFLPHVRQLAFRPDNGQLVRARGRLSLYEARGRFQLIADHLEDAGEGRLRAAFDALKRKLEEEGLFAPESKRPLPSFPLRIGVITSPSGAAVRDILHVLRRRWPLASVRLYPVPVQGAEAPAAICRALLCANRHGWADALVLGRGGGSLEDLWAFNEEAVARQIFASTIPVISAVGHETDFSISDFVADLRAPTPSAAAELLTPDQDALKRAFDAHEHRLARCIHDTLNRLSQTQDHLAHRLARQHPAYRLEQVGKALEQNRARLAASGRRLVPERQQALERARDRLWNCGRRLVPDRQRLLGELARTLHALSPLPTLDRGYAILTGEPTGRAIASVSEIGTGDRFIAQLRDGRLHATVDDIDPQALTDEPSDS